MFKFGFSDDNVKTEHNLENDTKWYEAKQIQPQFEKYVDEKNICDIMIESLSLKYISPTAIINNINANESNSVSHAESNHSDLVKAEYEGGLKIWECTHDLLQYLSNERVDFEGKRILDLGCGVGILGIYGLLCGGIVDFQDYNEEVLTHSTIPNCSLNNKLNSCRFYSGDWQSFLKLISNDYSYDFILTSETIYNTDNYKKLQDIFEHKLKRDGIVYLAAKTYYFGVGGGIHQFEETLNKSAMFKSTVCWTCTNGVQRKIIKIQKI